MDSERLARYAERVRDALADGDRRLLIQAMADSAQTASIARAFGGTLANPYQFTLELMPEQPRYLIRASTEVDRLAQRIHNALAEDDVNSLQKALTDSARLTELSRGLHDSLRSYLDDRHFFR